jgi:hypothetical protein
LGEPGFRRTFNGNIEAGVSTIEEAIIVEIFEQAWFRIYSACWKPESKNLMEGSEVSRKRGTDTVEF